MKLFIAALLLSIPAFAGNVNLTTRNTVVLRGEVNETSVTKAKLELMNASIKRGSELTTIYLVVQSPGGDIVAGLDLIDAIKAIPNVVTITYFAASMASAIVQQTPGERLIKGAGISMFHRAAGGVNGTFETGNLETRLDFYKRVVRSMESKNATRLGLSLKNYKEKVREELWFFGSENIENKAADRVVGVTCSKQLIEKRDIVEFNTFVGPVRILFSACPEFTQPIGAADQQSQKALNGAGVKEAIATTYLGVFHGVVLKNLAL